MQLLKLQLSPTLIVKVLLTVKVQLSKTQLVNVKLPLIIKVVLINFGIGPQHHV